LTLGKTISAETDAKDTVRTYDELFRNSSRHCTRPLLLGSMGRFQRAPKARTRMIPISEPEDQAHANGERTDLRQRWRDIVRCLCLLGICAYWYFLPYQAYLTWTDLLFHYSGLATMGSANAMQLILGNTVVLVVTFLVGAVVTVVLGIVAVFIPEDGRQTRGDQ